MKTKSRLPDFKIHTESVFSMKNGIRDGDWIWSVTVKDGAVSGSFQSSNNTDGFDTEESAIADARKWLKEKGFSERK